MGRTRMIANKLPLHPLAGGEGGVRGAMRPAHQMTPSPNPLPLKGARALSAVP